MKVSIVLFLSLLIMACNRDQPEKAATTPEELLMSNRWVLAQTHFLKFDSAANRVVEDTVVLADSCNANAPYRFLSDSICFKTMTCILTGATETQGKWRFKNDSLFAYVPEKFNYGNSYLIRNAGIEPSRLLQISSASFTVSRTEKWYAWSNGTPGTWTDTTIATYRRL